MRCDSYRRLWFAWATAWCAVALLHWATPISAAEPQSVAVAGITARDWPWWRGPSHDGHAAASQTVPLTWSDTENVLWSADVPGRGSSSPTVVGERIYLTSCDEAAGSQSVYAFDRASGRLVWTKQIHASGAMRKNSRSTGASSSIACDGARLFAAFPTSGAVVITALSLDGEQLWQTTLCEYVIHQGYGASPFLYQDTVLVVADHKGGGAVAALDRRTGNVVWKRERPPFPNYSSPIVFRLFGRDQLILTGCDKVISYDPATGDTLWEREGATTECVTTPVTDGERVFTSGGYPKNHVSAVRADGSAKVDWENGEREYVPSMILHEGHLYGVLDAGIAVCWDAATGSEKWKARLGGNFSASPVLLGDRIFAANETGETHVFRASPDRFESLAVNRLGDEAWATPAICGDRIYLRVASREGSVLRERLVCVGRAAAQPDATQATGDAMIRAPADGSEIVITTTSRLAGAIHSLTWNCREFIDSHDHGRQLQSASNLDLGGSFYNETFNPTEAGSMHDAAGPTSTSRLLWLSAAGRDLATVTQMAFWLRPGEASHGHPAVNTTPLSNHLLQKQVHIGAPGLPHAIRYAVTFTLPADERHGKATFETLTAYLPSEFRTFHGLRADDGLAPLTEGQGEQSLPVIASTADGGHAMGAWSPDKSRSTGQPATYGRFWFEHERVAKWNCVVREKADAAGGSAASAEGTEAGRLPPGEYRFLVWVAVGTREHVRDTLAQLRDRHVKLSGDRVPATPAKPRP